LQEEYEYQEEQVYHLGYEDVPQDNVEGDGEDGEDEEDEEEGDHYEGEHLDEFEIGPEQGQGHSISSPVDSPRSVEDGGGECIRRTPTEPPSTIPGSLYTRSPSPKSHNLKVHPTRMRHVRFAPGVISPAARPPRRIQAYSPERLAVTPERIDPPDPLDLQHPYPPKPKEPPMFSYRKSQETAKQSAGSQSIIPRPSLNRIPKTLSGLPSGDPAGDRTPCTSLKPSRGISEPSSFMRHPEPEPTQRVEGRSSSRVDETVDGLAAVDSSFDRSTELERIRQLEEEIKLLREEVSITPSHKEGGV